MSHPPCCLSGVERLPFTVGSPDDVEELKGYYAARTNGAIHIAQEDGIAGHLNTTDAQCLHYA
jgi:hypothetical protein